MKKHARKIIKVKAWAYYVEDDERLAIDSDYAKYAIFTSKQGIQANKKITENELPIVEVEIHEVICTTFWEEKIRKEEKERIITAVANTRLDGLWGAATKQARLETLEEILDWAISNGITSEECFVKLREKLYIEIEKLKQ